jgi:hypothetical protein
MRVLLVAEGASELGSDRDATGRPAGPRGALETLVRRLLSGGEIEFVSQKVGSRELGRLHGKSGPPYFKRAVQWLLYAEKHGFEALILLVDQDRQAERIRGIEDAQSFPRGVRRRALGVAIRTFDAWMLADETAVSRALNAPVGRQPDPEGLHDPRGRFEQLRDGAPTGAQLPELYAAIAEHLDVRTLMERCPKGFHRFADRIRGL